MKNIQVVSDYVIDLDNLKDVFKQQLSKVINQQSGKIKKWLNQASYSIIHGLIDPSSDKANIKINGKNIGKIKPDLSLYKTAFAKYVLSKSGAGELGLPDPMSAMKDLEFALLDSFKISINIRGTDVSLEFNLDLNKVLSRTPHPGKMLPNGKKIEAMSWLQWVTGPNFIQGISGYGLVRVGDIGRSKFKPRSLLYAGGEAGVMLSLNTRKSGKSPYEALTGKSGASWKPIQDFKDRFWENWIQANSPSIKDITLKIFQAILEEVLA